MIAHAVVNIGGAADRSYANHNKFVIASCGCVPLSNIGILCNKNSTCVYAHRDQHLFKKWTLQIGRSHVF